LSGVTRGRVAFVLVAALPVTFRAVVRAALREVLRRVDLGDPRLLLLLTAPNVRFVFPGRSSWAADTTDRADLERWVRRTAAVGITHSGHEILVNGPPWRLAVCMRISDSCTDAAGHVVYENVGVILAWMRWGRLVRFETHLDTEKVARLDEYLAGGSPSPATAEVEP
jgi:hypothetical protein